MGKGFEGGGEVIVKVGKEVGGLEVNVGEGGL